MNLRAILFFVEKTKSNQAMPPNENARDLTASGVFRSELIAHWIMHRPVQLLD